MTNKDLIKTNVVIDQEKDLNNEWSLEEIKKYKNASFLTLQNFPEFNQRNKDEWDCSPLASLKKLKKIILKDCHIAFHYDLREYGYIEFKEDDLRKKGNIHNAFIEPKILYEFLEPEKNPAYHIRRAKRLEYHQSSPKDHKKIENHYRNAAKLNDVQGCLFLAQSLVKYDYKDEVPFFISNELTSQWRESLDILKNISKKIDLFPEEAINDSKYFISRDEAVFYIENVLAAIIEICDEEISDTSKSMHDKRSKTYLNVKKDCVNILNIIDSN
jgi:hypothetical protein